jgi:hypothetical protein
MLELVDRFGNKIQPIAKDSIDLNVCGNELRNIELMDVAQLREIHAMLNEEGKALVGNFDKDLISVETFETGINITIANIGVILMLIKEKTDAEDAKKVVEEKKVDSIQSIQDKLMNGLGL